jgi:predicted thioesterase
MKAKPKIGTVGTEQFLVEPAQTIDFADQQLPAVLSTPSLIGWLERTARHTLQSFLEDGETSLGTEIELAHLAPTPVGSTVTCLTRVVRVEGTRVSFSIEARDHREPIAKGFHLRYVIRKDRFAHRVARKTPA